MWDTKSYKIIKNITTEKYIVSEPPSYDIKYNNNMWLCASLVKSTNIGVDITGTTIPVKCNSHQKHLNIYVTCLRVWRANC